VGVLCVSYRVLQVSAAQVLCAIYEQEFLLCTFGGPPGRSAHHALATRHEVIARGKVSWVPETDLKNYFGSLLRPALLISRRAKTSSGSEGAIVPRAGRAIGISRNGTRIHARQGQRGDDENNRLHEASSADEAIAVALYHNGVRRSSRGRGALCSRAYKTTITVTG
jgi:hypothetical protein